MSVICLENVTKTYKIGSVLVHALRGVSLEINAGEFVAIMGPSGSGKSTMLHVLGCLDRPTSGRVVLDGHDTSRLGDAELARLRGRKIGFVFQSFNLYPILDARENIILPMMIREVSRSERERRAEQLLEAVSLSDRAGHFPSQLSGGQNQRVAIARALANDPPLILADEPTGNLDSKSGEEILRIFSKLNSEGRTIVVVTHDSSVAAHARRVVKMKDGLVEADA